MFGVRGSNPTLFKVPAKMPLMPQREAPQLPGPLRADWADPPEADVPLPAPRSHTCRILPNSAAQRMRSSMAWDLGPSLVSLEPHITHQRYRLL